MIYSRNYQIVRNECKKFKIIRINHEANNRKSQHTAYENKRESIKTQSETSDNHREKHASRSDY